MRPAEEISNLINKIHLKASPNLDKRVRESISGDKVKFQKARSDFQNSFMRRIIMKNIKIKLAAAASLIVVCTILLIVLFNKTESEIKIQIPDELASMSVEELIKLHYGTESSIYDPNIIKAALQQALDKRQPEQIIQIAKNVVAESWTAPRGMGGGRGAAPPVHPLRHLSRTSITFPEVIEKSDIFVHANLKDIDINVDDIIKALIEKEQYRNFGDYLSKYRVSLPLYIIETLPKDLLKRGKMITLPAVINELTLNELKKNSGYYFCMTLDKDNKPQFLDYFSGVYAVDFNDPANIEFWPFLKDAQDILKFEKTPGQKTIDYWSSKLNGGTFLLALEYMNILPDELIPANSIMNAIAIKYADLSDQIQQNYNAAIANGETESDGQSRTISYANAPLFDKAMNLLVRADDKDSIKKMLVLFDNDIEAGNKSILWRRINDQKLISIIVRMNIALQENDTNNLMMDTYLKYKYKPLVSQYGNYNPPDEQVRFAGSLLNEIIRCAIDTQDEKNISMLSEMLHRPADLGIAYTTMEEIWKYLASSGKYDIRSELENILTDPAIFNLSSSYYYEQAAFHVLSNLTEDVRPSQEELVYYLLMIYKRNKDNSSCVYFAVKTLQEMMNLSESECLSILNNINIKDETR